MLYGKYVVNLHKFYEFVGDDENRNVDMDNRIQLSKDEIIYGFVISCIEDVADVLGLDYLEVYHMMCGENMIYGYIIPNYEVLHSESRKNVTDGLIDTLNRWKGGEVVATGIGIRDRAMSGDLQRKVRNIIRWQRIGCIVVKISENMNVSLKEALDMFYKSETCRRFHDEETGLYLQGNLYVLNDFLAEMSAF